MALVQEQVEYQDSVAAQRENVVAILSYKQFPFMENATLTVRWDAPRYGAGGGGFDGSTIFVTVHPWQFVCMCSEKFGLFPSVLMLRAMIKSSKQRIATTIDGMEVLQTLLHDHIDLMAKLSLETLHAQWDDRYGKHTKPQKQKTWFDKFEETGMLQYEAKAKTII